jgi:hypothetical protein
MKTTLPAREEYYRPARARELREKAARLDARAPQALRGISLSLSWLAGGIVQGWWLLHFSFHGTRYLLNWRVILLAVSLAVLAVLSEKCRTGLLSRIQILRQGADALEAEHQARYGAPLGEGA